MTEAKGEDIKYVTNYLTQRKTPPITIDQAYQTPKTWKKEYTYVRGEESHLVRRRMILKDHPQIAKLLVEDKPYTMVVALAVIAFMMANCYFSKVTIPQ